MKKLYLTKRLNTIEIAKEFGVSHSTVSNWIKKHRIPMRSRSERQIKLPKITFSGKLCEKAYMLGLRAGDLNAYKKGKFVRIQLTTTHPALEKTVKSVFGNYASIGRCVHFHKGKTHIEWIIYANLHKSFGFLIHKPRRIPSWIMGDGRLFYSFLAGYVDAEGNFQVAKSNENDVRFMFRLRAFDKNILKQIKNRLEESGFTAAFYLDIKSGYMTTFGRTNNDCYGVRIYRRNHVLRLIKILLKRSRHDEKITSMGFMMKVGNKKWDEVGKEFRDLRTRIKSTRVYNTQSRTTFVTPSLDLSRSNL